MLNPKDRLVDLHVHVEGALSAEFVKQRMAQLGQDPEGLNVWRDFQDFKGFLKGWWQTMGLLLAREDFEDMALQCSQEFGQRIQREGIVECEAHISPVDATYIACDGFDASSVERYQRLILAWDEGFDRLQKPHQRVRYLVDFVRNYPHEIASLQLEALEGIMPRLRHIAGVGVGGGGKARRLIELGPILQKVRALGLKTVVHAAEHPPESLARQEFFDSLSIGAMRIGHGIHALKSRELRQKAIDSGILFEICPSSNLATGSIRTREELPLDEWAREGLQFGVFADDPLWFGSDLRAEVEALGSVLLAPDDVYTALRRQGMIVRDES